MRILLGTVALLGLLPGSVAWADQVTLSNGDRLTGSIVELDTEHLRIKTEFLGEVVIPRNAIASLSADQPLTVALPDERVLVGTPSTQDGKMEVQTEAGPVTVAEEEVRGLRNPEAQAAYERRQHPGFLDLWQVSMQLGLSSRGRGGTTTLNTGLEATRRTKNDELDFSFHSLLESERRGSIVNDDKARASVLYSRNITDRFFYFGAGEFDHDALQNLSLRAVLGGGVGWYLKRTPRSRFSVYTGAGMDSEYFQDQSVRRSGEVLLGQALVLFLSSKNSLEERLIVYPNLSRGGEYRVQFTTSLVTELGRWFGWHLSFSNHYLSNPPPETKQNDILLTTGIRFRFGGGQGGRAWWKR